ncbi:hypothetical protein HYX12_03080 [Candidatus Woesearchaeota archaeon]|nr:hypothetical protein [Candidatus Woesearchaeota archaeon]
MVSEKALTIINLSLVFVSLLLLLNFLGIELPSLGQAQYWLDQQPPICVVQWKEQLTPQTDLERCCLEARKQLECLSNLRNNQLKSQDDFDWTCQTNSGIAYQLNNKAYYYCQQQPYW